LILLLQPLLTTIPHNFYISIARLQEATEWLTWRLKFAKDDSLNTVKEAIFQFIAWVKTQFGYSVKVMQSDLDRALGKEFVATLTDNGIEWHQAAKEQQPGK
jgi:hypothetical protein